MPAARVNYGPDASQYLELTIPYAGAEALPVAVVVHGGFWKAAYGIEYARPLVPSLVARGWATAAIEYRRVGNGGGFPNTLTDVAAAVDALAELKLIGEDGNESTLDVTRVVAIGHSAGGHLAAWLATRTQQAADAPGADPAVTVAGVVSQAGVLDLVAAATERLGDDAVAGFLGGAPDDAPSAYEVADPTQHLPLGVPVLCVHATDDANVPYAQSANFVRRAIDAGDRADMLRIRGDHFTVIDPADASWARTLDWIDRVR